MEQALSRDWMLRIRTLIYMCGKGSRLISTQATISLRRLLMGHKICQLYPENTYVRNFFIEFDRMLKHLDQLGRYASTSVRMGS